MTSVLGPRSPDRPMSLCELLRIPAPYFVRLTIGRLVLQPDVVMVAHLGTVAPAAFAIPVRIMLLAWVCASALAPLISTHAAECEGDAAKVAVTTRQSLSLAASLSAAL